MAVCILYLYVYLPQYCTVTLRFGVTGLAHLDSAIWKMLNEVNTPPVLRSAFQKKNRRLFFPATTAKWNLLVLFLYSTRLKASSR